MMKKTIMIIASIAAVSMVSCKKVTVFSDEASGTLSFAEFSISCNDEVETKATTAASGNYSIKIFDTVTESVALTTTYSAIKQKNNKVSLPAGNYRLVASSSEEGTPVAAFEQPVYGASKEFSISAGQTTSVGSIVCQLLQCKVTVSYSDEFLAMVTGAGVASVEVTAGTALDYALRYEGSTASYEQSAGYFSVNNPAGTTMLVRFKGQIEGKSQTMTKTFTNVKAKQWRQVKFIKKANEEGNATFDIVINSLVDDKELGNDVNDITEDIIGEDPSAPKGDGGITLDFDYAGGCDAEFTDLKNVVMPKKEEKEIHLILKSLVPNGVKKFTVDITSTSDAFLAALDAAQARTIDLVNPLPEQDLVFQVVPFPHGATLVGQTDIKFDLSKAQEAIVLYPGTHTFKMNVVDAKGCRNSFDIIMIVNE